MVTNVAAVVNPFQAAVSISQVFPWSFLFCSDYVSNRNNTTTQVWVGLISSLALIIVVLYLLRKNAVFGLEHIEQGVTRYPWSRISNYVFGSLLSQSKNSQVILDVLSHIEQFFFIIKGSYIPSKSWSFYLIGGVLSIATFVLVHAVQHRRYTV